MLLFGNEDLIDWWDLVNNAEYIEPITFSDLYDEPRETQSDNRQGDRICEQVQLCDDCLFIL